MTRERRCSDLTSDRAHSSAIIEDDSSVKAVLLPKAMSALMLVILVLLLPCAFAGALWLADVVEDRQNTVSVVHKAELLKLPPHTYPESNPVIGTLTPGEHLRVLRIRYGKDLMAIKVETPQGQKGWVIVGEGVDIVPSSDSRPRRPG